MMKKVLLLVGILFGLAAQAGEGLVIHTAEVGVGKFHRQDNKVHAYAATNTWAPYVLPEGADLNQPLTRKNADGSYTIFLSTLDELVANVTALSKRENKKVAVLNVHGHGLPGAMWFPKDAATLRSIECWDWSRAASGSDADNYNQYYSPVDSGQITQMRQISNNMNLHLGCTVGLNEWQQAAAKTPEFKGVFAPDAQIHFLSCIVGLGPRGDAFTKGIAQLLLPPGGRAYTSMNFGLGDWSMPLGMGFWDMQSEEQVARDADLYSSHKRDSEIAQKGTIRVSSFASGSWSSGLIPNRDFMLLSAEPVTALVKESVAPFALEFAPLPAFVRVPGTAGYVSVEAK